MMNGMHSHKQPETRLVRSDKSAMVAKAAGVVDTVLEHSMRDRSSSLFSSRPLQLVQHLFHQMIFQQEIYNTMEGMT